MAVIKQLKLHGFKSFAKSTEIPFSNGYSVVVGSNGSGKSNIADSLMFVLGSLSSKTMRAEKAPSLIYNGGKQHDPAKQAQVDIIFDNSKKEFSINSKEVKLSRIVRQNGQSVYKINDDVRTRQQVIELLGTARIDPDGHNIVLQGDIIKFTDMKPEDRRAVIEEAAGISVYEDKKRKSLNELEKVEIKLKEADIVLTERKTHLRELKNDRDQAIKYREIEGKIKENKATYLHMQIKQKENSREDIEKRLMEQEQTKEKIQKNIDNYKEEIQKTKDEIKSINDQIEKKGEKEQLALQKEIDGLKTSIIKKTARTDVLNGEIIKTKERIVQLKKNNVELDTKINNLKKELGNFEREKEKLSLQKEKIDDNIKKLKEKYNIKDDDSAEKDIENLQKEISNAQNEINLLLREHDKNVFMQDEINKKLDIDSNGDEENIKQLRQNFKTITLDLNKALGEDSMLSSKVGNIRKALLELNEKQAKLNAKSIVSRENPSAQLVKKIINSGIKGIYNTVGNLANVDKKYSLALEVAAGPRINAIVTEDDSVAAKCIEYLKSNRLGVVTFFPLNKIKPAIINESANIYSKQNGVHGLALNLIKYNPKFRNIFSYTLGSTLIVDDVAVARKIGVGNARMVTLEGDLLEQSGAMIGGFRRPLTGSGFKEEDLDTEIERLENEITNLRSNLTGFENKKQELEEKISRLRNEKINLESEIMKIEKISGAVDLIKLRKDKSIIEDKQKELSNKIKELEKKSQFNEKELTNLKDERSKSKTSGVKNLNDLEENKKNITGEVLTLESNIKSINTQINDILESEKNRTFQIIKNHEKEIFDFDNELKNLKEQVRTEQDTLKDNERKEKSFYSQFKVMVNKRNKLNEIIQGKENNLVRMEEQIRNVEEKKNNVSLDRAKIIAEIEGMGKEFEAFKDEKIRKNVNTDQIKYEIQRCEKDLQNMGNVNLRALEVYETLEEDYNKLTDKSEKLRLEKGDVLSMMQEIENQKIDSFLQTFKIVDKHFKENFLNISNKGQAYLELEDPKNPFNGGVEVKVRLIGNKYMDIRSLSGGEKTLTALAFIFAIQEFNTASFYLFDEVDAALDKTNSEKLSKLIARYASKAQYIVISHNDAVVSEAETIYGVSMQEGISKVISLKI